jgi:hypothetical protein
LRTSIGVELDVSELKISKLIDEFAAALPKLAEGQCQIKVQLDGLFRATNAVFESRRVRRQAAESLSRKTESHDEISFLMFFLREEWAREHHLRPVSSKGI